MPVHFDRFRLLNGGDYRRIRNESDRIIYVSAGDGDDKIPVAPGEESLLPESEDQESVIDVATEYIEAIE
jgi:hypothetical protein